VAHAAQPERNGDLARHHADDRDRNGVGRHLAATFDEKVVVLPLADVDPPAAAADDDARRGFTNPQARVVPRFPCGDDGDERGVRVPLRIRAVAGIPPVVALDRRHIVDGDAGNGRGDTAGEAGRVEPGDGPGPATATPHVIPEVLAPHAEGRHDADAGDDDARLARMAHTALS
jgi:hypothetical protein